MITTYKARITLENSNMFSIYHRGLSKLKAFTRETAVVALVFELSRDLTLSLPLIFKLLTYLIIAGKTAVFFPTVPLQSKNKKY